MDDPNESDDAELLPFAADAPLMVGLPVDAADGQTLGTVAEDAGDRFKIAAPLAPDYWLPRSLIAGMAPGGDLVVSVSSVDIDDVKLPDPDDES